MILTQLPGQEIQFELFDKDIDQDDFLGRCDQLMGKKYVSKKEIHHIDWVRSLQVQA